MHYRVTILTSFMALLLSSCASAPPGPPNKFGHYHDFPYKTPPQVSAADDEECGRRANSEAWESINRKNDYSYMFGALGVSLDFLFMNSQLNTKYEQVMKSCLREKGYKIPD